MDALEAALATRGRKSNSSPLPYPVYLGGGLNMLARQKFFTGDGWRGLRWIGVFGQDTSCNPDLGYVFAGTSNDHRYFILMRSAISNPTAIQRFSKECETATKETWNAPADKPFDREMTSAAVDSFQPNLDQLDAVIQSLKLKP